MEDLTRAITTEIDRWTEGAPITAAAFLHLGNRPAVSRTLRALARGSVILRVAHGVYVAPVDSRFGFHAPQAHLLVQQLAAESGDAIAPSGAATANALGLTTQVPTKIVYWTSGRARSYNLGKLTVYLQHVPAWQLVLWDEPPGELVRALAWAGPPMPAKSSARSPRVLSQIAEKVPEAAIRELQQHASRFPLWLHDALQQIGQPRMPSSRGEWDVSDLRGNGISRSKKAK